MWWGFSAEDKWKERWAFVCYNCKLRFWEVLIRGDSRSIASLGLITHFLGLNTTVRGLCHWNFHLLSFWLPLSLLCDVGDVTVNEKFSWEPVHCYVTRVTNQWWRQLVLCVLGSLILARVTGQFFVRLKLFSNGNCPLEWTSKSMFYANPLLQEIFNVIWIIFLKIL